MLYWQEELVEEAPGAIVVEIAPVATALASRHARSAARPAVRRARGHAVGVRPQIAKVQEEAPKEELPSPVESEVVLPKPTPVEETPRKNQSRRRARKCRSRRSRSPRSKATAPQRVDAQIATKAAAPEVGTAASNARSVVTWQNSVVLHLNRHKRYPGAPA